MSVYRFRKEELEAHLNKNALWAIVYGDMMSYLMIMFLVMLSYQLSTTLKTKRDKTTETIMEIQRVFGAPVDPKLAQRAKETDLFMMGAQKIKEVAQTKDLQNAVKVIVTEQWARIDMQDTGIFDSGSAELKPGCFPILETIAKSMISKDNLVQVEGHTDDRPLLPGSRYSNNWELSMARAYSVIRKLEESGIDPKQLSGSGYGQHRPVTDNATAEGRTKNRRIEIKVLRSVE